jgi:hypothetical protein
MSHSLVAEGQIVCGGIGDLGRASQSYSAEKMCVPGTVLTTDFMRMRNTA